MKLLLEMRGMRAETGPGFLYFQHRVLRPASAFSPSLLKVHIDRVYILH
jgi:hypothetical protein